MTQYDRREENLGNIVSLEHVNTRVPDQQLATAFYVSALGLTRDPYIMTGTNNMWINAGRAQFHLPTGDPQIVRGTSGVVMEGRDALLDRLNATASQLDGTKFAFSEASDHVAVTCPWGNRIRCHEPGPNFGEMRLGIPYVELDVPRGTSNAIARFYDEIVAAPSRLDQTEGDAVAVVSAGNGQELRFREADVAPTNFDGHHVAVYFADFSGPYERLTERGLISQETDQHEYRFIDIVDLATGETVFQLEHEVRSMRHPMYARPLINRNPAINNRNYVPGYQDAAWAVI